MSILNFSVSSSNGQHVFSQVSTTTNSLVPEGYLQKSRFFSLSISNLIRGNGLCPILTLKLYTAIYHQMTPLQDSFFH